MSDPAPEDSPTGIVIGWAFVAVLASLPLNWIIVRKLGGFQLTLPYAMTLLLGCTLLLQLRRSLIAFVRLMQDFAVWFVPYLVYLYVLKLHLAGLPDNGMILRQVFFLICAVIVATAVLVTRGDMRLLRRGGMAALLGFVVICELLARRLGMSWITAIEHFAVGDLQFIIYKFFRAIFDEGSDADVAASIKNVVSGGLFIALILYRAGHDSAAPDRRGQMVTVLTLGLLVLLNTRSVLLVAALAAMMAGVLATIRRPVQSANALLVKGMVLVAAIVLVTGVLLSNSAATGMIESRFAFEDASTSGRFDMFSSAISLIEQNVFNGAGFREFNGLPVHNLFLGAWLHGGLLTFLLVALCYGAMVWTWLRFVLRIAVQRSYWILPVRPEWVAVLPMLALIRVWLAGDAGHPGFAEWVSIVIFFALVQVNALVRPPLVARLRMRDPLEVFS